MSARDVLINSDIRLLLIATAIFFVFIQRHLANASANSSVKPTVLMNFRIEFSFYCKTLRGVKEDGEGDRSY